MLRLPLFFLLVLLGCSFNSMADSPEEYLSRFKQYQHWSEALPLTEEAEFLNFIQVDRPLSKHLREKWLYFLASHGNWGLFTKYYQPSLDLNLQCWYQDQLYQQQGNSASNQASLEPLWLSPTSLPPACSGLFAKLLKQGQIPDSLIAKRLILALENRNLSLAQYLLKQFKIPRLQDIRLLQKINSNPQSIRELGNQEFHSSYYVFGLKRLVPRNLKAAIALWELIQEKRYLSESEKQAFLAQVALYKAMRTHEDTEDWFAKVKPEYYNESLLDWQIRYALKQENWAQVERLIQASKNKNEANWQYWLARAMEAQGRQQDANRLYESLAKTRQYYGFLASYRLHQPYSFENENPLGDQALAVYQPIMQQLKQLYQSKEILKASRLVNDFILELPKDETAALANWLAIELQWYAKSLQLCNNEALSNQLSLRFPLAYSKLLQYLSNQYRVPLAFIYAIIRQESTFREDALSSAGAQGLMQLMPQTAKTIARQRRIAYQGPNPLYQANTNIHIGVAYLAELLKRFNGNMILAAAAYNAGPHQALYWQRKHLPKALDIWVDTLPWQETRNYIKNVISFYLVYQYRLQEKPDLALFFKDHH